MKYSKIAILALQFAIWITSPAALAAPRFDTEVLKANLDATVDHVRAVRMSKQFGPHPLPIQRGLTFNGKKLNERQTKLLQLAVEQFSREEKAWSQRHNKGQFKILEGIYQVHESDDWDFPAIRFSYSSDPKQIFTACVCVFTDDDPKRTERVLIGPYATDINYGSFEFLNFGPLTSPSLSCKFLGDDPLLRVCAAPRGKLIRIETLHRGGGEALASPDIIKLVEELLGGPR
jgi:hypothetical protein